MTNVPVQDLRRVAEALLQLHGRSVVAASMRSDLRQVKIELADGLVIVVAADIDEDGRPRLEVDVVRLMEDPSRQLEVHFDSA
ncbi:MAG: hypothetical protein V3S19_06840 [Gemmatimonadales bacterium]